MQRKFYQVAEKTMISNIHVQATANCIFQQKIMLSTKFYKTIQQPHLAEVKHTKISSTRAVQLFDEEMKMKKSIKWQEANLETKPHKNEEKNSEGYIPDLRNNYNA